MINTMSNRENRGLSRRLLAWVAALCFGFGYCIGCDEKHGDTNDSDGTDKTIDAVVADSGLVASRRDSSTDSNTADIAISDSAPIAPNQGGSAGSTTTDGAVVDSGPIAPGQDGSADSTTTDVAVADSGPIAPGQDGSAGSKDSAVKGGITTCSSAEDVLGTEGNSTIGLPPVTSVVPAMGYICLHKTDGTFVCWGENSHGQAEAPAISFTQMGAVWAYACALNIDGSIVCWGNLNNMEPPVGSFTQISVGLNTNYAVREDGSIACWGNSCSDLSYPFFRSYLQVSAGHPQDRVSTCAVGDDNRITCWGFGVDSGNTAPEGCYTQVAGNCAIRCDGTLVCWGCSMLIRGSKALDVIAGCGPISTPVGLSTRFIQISYGLSNRYCGVASDNSITCWKYSFEAPVEGKYIYDPIVVRLAVPPGSYTEVNASKLAACAMKSDDSFACWPLRNTDNDDTEIVPIILAPYGPYTQIGNNCALKSDGQIVCNGATAMAPYGMTAAVPSGPYTQIGNNCGLKSDGTITCWSKKIEDNSVLERTEIPAPNGSYTQLGNANSKSDFNCAIKSDGAIACWDWGATDSSGSELLRVLAAPPGSYTQVNGSAALKNDGTITCWEWDSDDSGIVNPDSYSLISTPPGSYAQVTYADGLGCGIRSDGSLLCWGNDEYDDFMTNVPSGSFTRVSTSGKSAEWGYGSVASLACAIRVDESIVCWDEGGQKEVPSGSYGQVFAGVVRSCAIQCDNSIVCWDESGSQFFPATL